MNRLIKGIFGLTLLVLTSSGAVGAAEEVPNVETPAPNPTAEHEALLKLLAGSERADERTEAKPEKLTEKRPVVRRSEPGVARKTGGSARGTDAFSTLLAKLEASSNPETQRRELEAFVERFPEHRDARLNLARAHVLALDAHGALTALQPLLTPAQRRGHPDWQAWFWAGSAHLIMHDLVAAREHLEVAVDKNGAAVHVWVQLAVVEQELGETAAAIQYLEIAEQIDSDLAEIYLNRAYALEHDGRFDAALMPYKRYLASRSDRTGGVRLDVLKQLNVLASATAP